MPIAVWNANFQEKSIPSQMPDISVEREIIDASEKSIPSEMPDISVEREISVASEKSTPI